MLKRQFGHGVALHARSAESAESAWSGSFSTADRARECPTGAHARVEILRSLLRQIERERMLHL